MSRKQRLLVFGIGVLSGLPVALQASNHFNQLGTSPAYQQLYQQFQQQQYQQYQPYPNRTPAARAPVYDNRQVDDIYRSNERYLQQYPDVLNTYPHPSNTSRPFEVEQDRFTRSRPSPPPAPASAPSGYPNPGGGYGYGQPTTGRVLGQDDWPVPQR